MIKTSTGVQELRRRIAIKAKADASHRFWGLYCHVWKIDTLSEAYRLAKINRGAPGIDGKSFSDIESEGVMQLITSLSQELREGIYQPQPLRVVKIPKANGKMRVIKIATIRDRIVQGALKIVLEPIFEMDFQEGSFGYRPRRTAHQAMKRIKGGIRRRLTDVIDLDLKSYFDTIRHHLLLEMIAKRVNDPKVMKLCKQILKTSGKIGLPQGSIIGPVFSNLFLNGVDQMLEKAQSTTQYGMFENIRYVRFADDIVVLFHASEISRRQKWMEKVMFRLREEFAKLDLTINEEKTKIIRLAEGETLDFLGYNFRLIAPTPKIKYSWTLQRPMREKRTAFLREITSTLRRNRFRPVEEVVQKHLNPKIRGWVNYFRRGNSGQDLSFVKWQIEIKVRKFATRQTPKKRKGGRRWTTWSQKEVYGNWKLYSDYKVIYGS